MQFVIQAIGIWMNLMLFMLLITSLPFILIYILRGQIRTSVFKNKSPWFLFQIPMYVLIEEVILRQAPYYIINPITPSLVWFYILITSVFDGLIHLTNLKSGTTILGGIGYFIFHVATGFVFAITFIEYSIVGSFTLHTTWNVSLFLSIIVSKMMMKREHIYLQLEPYPDENHSRRRNRL